MNTLNIINAVLETLLLSTIDYIVILSAFLSILKLNNFKPYLDSSLTHKQEISKILIFSFLLAIFVRVIMSFDCFLNTFMNTIVSSLAILVVPFIYFKTKTKKWNKFSIWKYIFSYLLTTVFVSIIELIFVFIVTVVFEINFDVVKNNFSRLLMLSVPVRILQIFFLIFIHKINKKVIKNCYSIKSAFILLIILLTSIFTITIPVVNSNAIKQFNLEWKMIYITNMFIGIGLFYYLFIWANNKSIKDSLSEQDRLSFLTEIMERINFTTENITNVELLQNTLLNIIYHFVKPSYMFFWDSKKCEITYIKTFNSKKISTNVFFENIDYINDVFKQNKKVTDFKNPLNDRNTKSVIYMPLFMNKKKYGLLMLEHEEYNYFDTQFTDILTILSQYLVKSLMQSQTQNNLKNFADVDYLTLLFNRRYFNNTINDLCEKSDKIGVMMLDIDFFKKVNDKYGHYVGDEVLKEISQVIKNSIRPQDIAARYGGEEFIISFVDIDADSLLEIAERIRTRVENHEILYNNEKIKVTVSIGVSYTNSIKGNYNDLLLNADKALYKSKDSGRNKCSYIPLLNNSI